MATNHQLTRLAGPNRTPVQVVHPQKTSRPQLPAFLQKLYEMLNNPNNFHLIRWSEAGDSFIVPNHEQLARELLGRWFKHQSSNTFVRQLNMYGFHKIPQLQQGVLKSDSDTEVWNFAHPHFRRGEPHLLKFIQRKRPVAQSAQADASANSKAPTEPGQVLDIQSIVNELGAIKRLQSSIQAELTEVKQLNQLLWQDATHVRAKCQKQEDTISSIVKFLASMFGTRTGSHCMVDGLNSGVFATRPTSRLMIEDGRNEKDAVRRMPGDEDEDEPGDETQFVGPDEFQTRQAQDHSDDAFTSSCSPNPSQSFDIQQALSQLSPQQISQLISLTFPTSDSNLLNSFSAPSTSPSSQLTSYQPSCFDFSQFTQPSRNEQEQDIFSFDPISLNLDKQPDVTDNLDKEVTMLDSSIHSFMQDMGLDPRNLDANAALLPPMLDLDQQQPSLHPLATQLPADFSQTQTELQPTPSSSSSLPSPSTSTDPFSVLQVPPPTSDDFDMYRCFDVNFPKDDDGLDADVDDWDPSTAFVDDIQVPPEPETRVSAPHVSSEKSGGGKKRKSDVALGEAQMEVTAPPTLEPEPALSGQPPKRGGVMNMNVTRTATKPAKRRKNH